jgi:hypothetical protein
MFRAVIWLLILTVACREGRSGVPKTSPPDVALRSDSAWPEDGEPGVEFEAPRMIPAARAQITRIRERPTDTVNLTAFRNNLGGLVSAMQTDLHRVGVTDTGYFRELSDSVLRGFGGGRGAPAPVNPDEARRLTAQVERIIGLYETRMRAAAK